MKSLLMNPPRALILAIGLILVQPLMAAPPAIPPAAPIADSTLFANPPGDIPKLFGGGFISLTNRDEYGLALSPDGKELLFTAGQSLAEGPSGLLVTRKSADGHWSVPAPANLRKSGLEEFEAFYSPDGSSLFFAGVDGNGRCRIWRVERAGGAWVRPALIEGSINADDVFWPSVSRDGTLYATDIKRQEIYFSAPTGGKYGACEKLPFPRGIIHSSVSPDGSFMLCNNNSDIFVAFRKAGGGWTTPMGLGPKIDTRDYDEACASLSPDGKYIFFSRYDDVDKKSNIYWVSSSVIELLRPKS